MLTNKDTREDLEACCERSNKTSCRDKGNTSAGDCNTSMNGELRPREGDIGISSKNLKSEYMNKMKMNEIELDYTEQHHSPFCRDNSMDINNYFHLDSSPGIQALFSDLPCEFNVSPVGCSCFGNYEVIPRDTRQDGKMVGDSIHKHLSGSSQSSDAISKASRRKHACIRTRIIKLPAMDLSRNSKAKVLTESKPVRKNQGNKSSYTAALSKRLRVPSAARANTEKQKGTRGQAELNKPKRSWKDLVRGPNSSLSSVTSKGRKVWNKNRDLAPQQVYEPSPEKTKNTYSTNRSKSFSHEKNKNQPSNCESKSPFLRMSKSQPFTGERKPSMCEKKSQPFTGECKLLNKNKSKSLSQHFTGDHQVPNRNKSLAPQRFYESSLVKKKNQLSTVVSKCFSHEKNKNHPSTCKHKPSFLMRSKSQPVAGELKTTLYQKTKSQDSSHGNDKNLLSACNGNPSLLKKSKNEPYRGYLKSFSGLKMKKRLSNSEHKQYSCEKKKSLFFTSEFKLSSCQNNKREAFRGKSKLSLHEKNEEQHSISEYKPSPVDNKNKKKQSSTKEHRTSNCEKNKNQSSTSKHESSSLENTVKRPSGRGRKGYADKKSKNQRLDFERKQPSESSEESSTENEISARSDLPVHYIERDGLGQTCESVGENCPLCQMDLSYAPMSDYGYEYDSYDYEELETSKLPDVTILACGHSFHSVCFDNTILPEQFGDPPCILCISLS